MTKSSSKNMDNLPKLYRYIAVSRVSMILTVPVVVILGELGRMNFLPDGRSIPPTVQGLQGVFVLAWIVYHLSQIKKLKKIRDIPEVYQSDKLIVRKKQILDIGVRVLIPTTFLLSFFNTYAFSASLLVLLIVVFLQIRVNHV